MKDAFWRRLVRFAFHEFYNHFAFTYDIVSALVSRGAWRDWTRAAIPYLRGTRILEIAFGTGNLHLDLYEAGYAPIGIDLSPYMHALTQKKFRRRARNIAPRLVRADVRGLPFPNDYFSSLVMTFPPGFMYDPRAVREMHRVLEPKGALVWVDDAQLEARDAWSRFLHWAFVVTGTTASVDEWAQLMEAADAALWDWRVVSVELPNGEGATSRVHVFIATKRFRSLHFQKTE